MIMTPLFCEQIPEQLDEGIIYISEEYGVSIHLCACGGKGKTALPLEKKWKRMGANKKRKRLYCFFYPINRKLEW